MTVRLQIVAPESFIEKIDEWRSAKRPIPSRAEAIRLLVERGLTGEVNDAIVEELRIMGKLPPLE